MFDFDANAINTYLQSSHGLRRSKRRKFNKPLKPSPRIASPVPRSPARTPSPQRKTMNSDNGFDPYQVFEVDHRPCMMFHVHVKRARNVTKGWAADLLDTPDPYIQLRMRNAPDGRKRTKTLDNEKNPVWDESFTFLLDITDKNILQIDLMEDNYLMDQVLGTNYFNINQLTVNKWMSRTLIFKEVTEVDMEMMIQVDAHPTLRYSLCLCDEEKAFLEKRKAKTYESMRRLLGKKGPQNMQEVPTVAVLGSGGGFRAMVSLSGVFKALSDSGILDCTTYVCGLSGSSWYISTLYSHPEWPAMPPGGISDELKSSIDSSLLWLLKPQNVYRNVDMILNKRQQGQPISFTDFFGLLVGETLLRDRIDVKLSNQQQKIEDGGVPMPMYTCVHVKKDVSAKSFQEWVEFTPYEIGMPKYGTYMKTNLFGSKFFMGKLCRQFPEPPLHYLQGIWGSAFCILFKRLLDDKRTVDPVEMIRQEMEKELDQNMTECTSDSSDDEYDEPVKKKPASKKKMKMLPVNKPPTKKNVSIQKTKQKTFWNSFLSGLFESKSLQLLSTRSGRAGVIHNFMRGLSLQKTYPLSPFTPAPQQKQSNGSADEFDGGIFEMHPTHIKHLYMVDAGLTFNSPYPLALRSQRGVDIILSFDFSARPSDNSQPFKELLLAEKWARLNCLPFPPIDTTVFDREGIKELYVFKHPTNPHCPVILHFTLVNKEFRKFKKPGVARKTQAEKDMANYDIFDDVSAPYSTFNFKYSHQMFDRLSKLMEFNTLLSVGEIKKALVERIETKRVNPPKVPIASKDIKHLMIKSIKNRKKLTNYIQKVESLISPTLPHKITAFGLESVCEGEEVVVNEDRAVLTKQNGAKMLLTRRTSLSLTTRIHTSCTIEDENIMVHNEAPAIFPRADLKRKRIHESSDSEEETDYYQTPVNQFFKSTRNATFEL